MAEASVATASISTPPFAHSRFLKPNILLITSASAIVYFSGNLAQGSRIFNMLLTCRSVCPTPNSPNYCRWRKRIWSRAPTNPPWMYRLKNKVNFVVLSHWDKMIACYHSVIKPTLIETEPVQFCLSVVIVFGSSLVVAQAKPQFMRQM